MTSIPFSSLYTCISETSLLLVIHPSLIPQLPDTVRGPSFVLLFSDVPSVFGADDGVQSRNWLAGEAVRLRDLARPSGTVKDLVGDNGEP